MADIFHHFPIKATQQKVFEALSTPKGLDVWWAKRSSGEPEEGAEYKLSFGPGYDWQAVVSRCVPDTEFELELTSAQEDWQGTHVGFQKRALPRYDSTIWVGLRITSTIAFHVTAGRCSSDYSNDRSNMVKLCRMKIVLMCDDFNSVWF